MESRVKYLTGNRIVIYEKITNATARRNFESSFKRMHPLPLDMKGQYHASHAFGSGWGAEHRAGIFYAPADLNLKFQNAGIEKKIRILIKNLDETKTELWVVIDIIPVSENDYRLKEITYSFSFKEIRTARVSSLFELTLDVDYKTFKHPKINVHFLPLRPAEELAMLLNV